MAGRGDKEQACLRRPRAPSIDLIDHAPHEAIGQGPLWKMARAALTDPDGELWRYSIFVGDEVFAGERIHIVLGPST